MDNLEIETKITEWLIASNFRHEVHHFSSDAIMIDIWPHSGFYVVQIDGAIGFSLIDDINPPFCSRPDEEYADIESFKIRLDALLKPA